VVALGQLVGGDLGGRVRGLGLQRVLLGDRHELGAAVDLAGRGAHHLVVPSVRAASSTFKVPPALVSR